MNILALMDALRRAIASRFSAYVTTCGHGPTTAAALHSYAGAGVVHPITSDLLLFAFDSDRADQGFRLTDQIRAAIEEIIDATPMRAMGSGKNMRASES
jgi:hypothetical protein